MKNIYLFLLPAVLLFTACTKQDVDYNQPPINESYWLAQEPGIVVYADGFCDYFVVETARGYSILRSWGFTPYRGARVYGDFSRWGMQQYYNRSQGYVGRADVRDYWLNYFAAQDMLDYYCGGDTFW